MSYELFVSFWSVQRQNWKDDSSFLFLFFFFPQSGGVASSVASVLWDLTLLLSAMRNTTRQAINLRGKRRRRFRNTWKQPTGVERMDFRSPRPFSSPWMGVGGRKTEERNLKEKKKRNSIFCCPLFSALRVMIFFFFPHAGLLRQSPDLLMNALQLISCADVTISWENVFVGLIANLQKGTKNNFIEATQPTYAALSKQAENRSRMADKYRRRRRRGRKRKEARAAWQVCRRHRAAWRRYF